MKLHAYQGIITGNTYYGGRGVGQREIAEHVDCKDKKVVRKALECERRNIRHMFESLMKLHYSQTMYASDAEMAVFESLMKLHYSQTEAYETFIDALV